ncbi:MAG TPA: TonB family protein, partial [bacterium]|nr:TonB family protein [bacterium]
GYVNNQGALIIAPRYREAHRFEGGLAAVNDQGKWGYIGKDGSAVIPATFQEARDFDRGLAMARVGNNWAYIDSSGRTIWGPAPWKDTAPEFGKSLLPRQSPQVAERATPRYPNEAKQAGVQGTVVVKALVDRSGNVRKATILQSANDQVLNGLALDAARRSRFLPGKEGSDPAVAWTEISFEFKK